MALTITSLTSATSTTSGSTLVLSGITAAVGDFLLLTCAADNAGTSGVSSTSSTITDAAGNTWTQQSSVNQGTSANVGTTLTVWSCLVSHALSSASITINFSPNTTSKAAVLDKAVAAAGETISIGSVGAGFTGNVTSLSTGNVNVSLNQTIFGFIAKEGNNADVGDSDTTNGTWSTPHTAVASTGTSTTSQAVLSQYKTPNASGNQSFDLSLGTARNVALNYLVLYLNKTLTAGQSSFALAGEAAGLKYDRRLTATQASFTLNGRAFTPEIGMPAARGSFALSGQPAALHATRSLIAEPAVLHLTAPDTQGGAAYNPFPESANVVIGYGAPPLPFGTVDDLAEAGTFVLYRGLNPLNLGAHEGQHYLLVAAPFDPGAEIAIPAPPLPFGDAGDGTGQAIVLRGLSDDRYPASTLGRSTAPDDVPASVWVPGRLKGRINFQIDLFGQADPTTAGRAGVGILGIVDPEGELDDLLPLGWDGARMSLRRGREEDPFKAWSTVAVLTSSAMLPGLAEKQLNIRDLSFALTSADLHGQVYAGTGGLEGDPALNLVGQPKPYAAGYPFNITPKQLSATLLIWQVSFTSVRAITAVRDGGIALLATTDYPTYEALAAATIAGGRYATCLARGLFRLGAQPTKGVTADVEGDNDLFGSQRFPHTRGQIARRIATRLGLVRLSEATQFDFGALADLENAQPAPVGFYWSDTITKADALTQVMKGCMGYWFVRIDGRLMLGQIDDPEAGAPYFTISYPAEGSGEARLEEPECTAELPPRRATFVGYRKNYTVQQPAQLQLGLTASEIQAYGQASLYAAAADQWTANNYPTSPAIYVDGNYRDQVDAAAEASRQQRIWSVKRRLYEVPGAIDPFADVIGRRASIDNLNRLGWGASKRLLCCGIDVAEAPTPTWKFWG